MKKRAFSLVELLVVIGIIIVLAAITAAVMVRARDNAKVTADISNMRQIGVAALQYQEEYDGTFPVSPIILAEVGRVPKELLSSPRDATTEGLAIAVARETLPALSKPVPAPGYRVSFVGLAEMGFDMQFANKHLHDAKGVGWLVDLLDCEPRAGSLAGATGRYRRLLLDGSVQRRVQKAISFSDDGQSGMATHPLTFFIDEDEAWLRERSL
jgi:type II secretory pathway pseudopilin PulG